MYVAEYNGGTHFLDFRDNVSLSCFIKQVGTARKYYDSLHWWVMSYIFFNFKK